MATTRNRLVKGLDKKIIKGFDKRLEELRKEIISELQKLIGKDTFDLSSNGIFICDTNTEEVFNTIDSTSAETDNGATTEFISMSTDLLLMLLENINDNISILKE